LKVAEVERAAIEASSKAKFVDGMLQTLVVSNAALQSSGAANTEFLQKLVLQDRNEQRRRDSE
jgi:hypothetical protein